VSSAKEEFGQLNFGAKLRIQEAKAAGIAFDPNVKLVVQRTLKELESL
jgi:hypothetical protein